MTTNLITAFENSVSDAHTDDDLIELVDYVLEQVDPIAKEQYFMDSIGLANAADVAFANPSVCDDYFEANPMEPELIMNHMPSKQLAYHLTFTEPAKATELLDELLYYRTHGRI